MSSSGAKRWIIGLVILLVIVLAAAAYLMSGRPSERADKGTLVRTDRGTLMRTIGDCL